MEYIIYFSTFQDFAKAISEAKDKTAYLRTVTTARKDKTKDYVCIFSGFDANDRAIQVRLICESIKSDAVIAIKRAQNLTKEKSEHLKQILESQGIEVKNGIVQGATVPCFGVADG